LATANTDRVTWGVEPMATLPLKALWIGDKPVEFAEGSTLDTDLQTLVVVSVEVRLPFGFDEKVTVKAELKNGTTYAGDATSKMPRDVGGRNQPTLHVYEFFASTPLEPAS
jgi:hypothetical protein